MLLSFLAVFLLFILAKDIRTFQADRIFWKIQTSGVSPDWREADTKIEKALKNVPKEYYYHDLAGSLSIKPVNETGDPRAYHQGAELLEKAYGLYPFDPYTLIHRIDLESKALKQGLIKNRSDFTDFAVKQLASLDKNNPAVYITIARLSIREGRYREALALIDRANALNPRARGPREWIAAKQGIFYEQINENDYHSALKTLREIVNQFPDDVLTHILLGKLYFRLKQLDKARASFDQALKLEPANRPALEGRNMLNEWKN